MLSTLPVLLAKMKAGSNSCKPKTETNSIFTLSTQ